MARSLTDKQQAFADYYIGEAGWNATEAAAMAGYSGSRATLGSIGSENLTKPKIRRYIEERLEEVAMSANEVLARLTDQARTSIADLVEIVHYQDDAGVWHTRVKIDREALRTKGHVVKSIRETRNGIHLDLHDGQSALVKLGEFHALFKTKVEHSGEIKTEQPERSLSDDELAEIVRRAREEGELE